MDVSEPINANADTSDAGIGNTTPDFDTSAWSGSPVFCANDPDAVDGGGSPVDTCLDSVSGSLKNPESTDTLFPMFFATASVIDNLGRRHVIVTSGDRQWPSNDSTQVGHAQSPFGYLYNFIDEYVPSFFRGSSTSTTNTFKTVFDIDGSVANGDTLTITASGQNFIITPEHDNQDGEFLVKFANGCDTGTDGCTIGGEKGVGTPVVINSVLLFTT
ncbi:MAG: hypothetical protein GWN81_01485, partial [Phycisphaerae bacterium]|nr:hypothetical protein [Phycisphaerae bacterium]NIU07550.1 hypothetical protein [Phycisphaerae bacterium]NIW46277.1 hypothetical protein [Gammaproteobacteria bacterium]NIW97001.1 hypothetical protein [Phycisphaerae bacterium]